MKKLFKKITILLFVATMCLSFMLLNQVFANSNLDRTMDDSFNIEELEMYKKAGLAVKVLDDDLYTVYEVTITDKNVLEQYKETNDEELVARTLIYYVPKKYEDEDVDKYSSVESEDIDTTSGATPSPELRNWKYVGNQFYISGDGTPYRVDGPANISLATETTSYWSINGSVSRNIKKIIEAKIGGTAGQKNVKSWKLDISVPSGYYRKIEVWEYLTKYTFDVYYNNSYMNSGSALKPNGGLKVSNNLYKK